MKIVGSKTKFSDRMVAIIKAGEIPREPLCYFPTAEEFKAEADIYYGDEEYIDEIVEALKNK